MKDTVSLSRRSLLQSSFSLVVCGATTMLPVRAGGAELPRVTEDEPTAVALKYKHDATASERPNAEQFCHNCRYFKGTQQTEWERCDLFPGKTVNTNGWCNVWAMKG